jgi:alkylation response protein AidB-like acyl-CoA dehydrogenase
MNAPASKIDLDNIVLDKPMFDPKAYRLDDEAAGLITKARELAQANFAGRAAKWDKEATFPLENYKDLHKAGLLGISIPKENGGSGAGYQTYSLAAAEIGR